MSRHERGRRERVRRLAAPAAAVLRVTVLLALGWNGPTVEQGGAGPAGLRHALSMAAAISGTDDLAGAAGRLGGTAQRLPRAWDDRS